MAREWEGAGPEFRVEWAGRSWTLRVDGPRPGLRASGQSSGALLALEGISVRGRSDPDALSGATLVSFERRLDRIEATYAPPGWGGLTVRAAWNPSGVDGIDLEVQASALSVDELKALEVRVASDLADPAAVRPGAKVKRWVEPRDARSAGLSYDGREADVFGLTTLPPDEQSGLAPRVIASPWAEGESYAEMVHPHDASRRITESTRFSTPGLTTRYGLFGLDLEKGVVVRARLRGVWFRAKTPEAEALVRMDRFLREPPPLGM